MKVHIAVTVEVDPDAWATIYGSDPSATGVRHDGLIRPAGDVER